MAERALIKESLFLLNTCGIDPHKSNAKSKVRAAISLVVLLWFMTDMLLEIVLNWSGLDTMQLLTIFFAVYQITTKFILTLVYRKGLVKAIRKFNKFWPLERSSAELQSEIESIHLNVRKAVKFMVVQLVFMVLAIVFLPVFRRELPFKTYYSNNLKKFPQYETALLSQTVLSLIAIVTIFGADGLFVSLIINLTCELKVLKEGFRRVPINQKEKGDFKKTLPNLNQMIEYHGLILECIADIRDMYSMFLLNVFFYSVALISVGLLSIIISGFPPSLESLGRFGVLTVFYALQLFFYCAAGTYLIAENDDVPDVVYETNWVETDIELRKSYVLILMRANKVEALKAGGMFTLNLDSFTEVMKSTFSLFTLVEAMYEA